MRIDQFLPDFAPHDAIGNHVLEVQKLLRGSGYESDIYADVIHAPVANRARHYRKAARAGGAVALYHASTFSDLAPWLAARAQEGARLFAYYHNITPATYFARWEPVAAAGCDRARRELVLLAPHTELALAASAYNEAELTAAGYPRTATSPLLVDLDAYHDTPDQRALDRLRRESDRGGARWLFVGRLAPNKCQHDVIGAFAAFRKGWDPRARLVLAGGPTSARYLRALRGLVAELDLGESVELPGALPLGELLAHFSVADVFVCCSEHEGFCVPILESMELGVPVVAYRAAAVPETVGDAGVLLDDKDPLTTAAAVASLLADDEKRSALVDAGRERAATFSLKETSAAFLKHVESQLRAS